LSVFQPICGIFSAGSAGSMARTSPLIQPSPGVWYVKTWLGADQIKRRLAILFDHPDELGVHELGRADATVAARLHWMQGRLEDEEPVASWQMPRVWAAFQSAVSAVGRPSP